MIRITISQARDDGGATRDGRRALGLSRCVANAIRYFSISALDFVCRHDKSRHADMGR